MKHKLSLLVGLASLAALVGATAQTSAVTDPVGYITTTVAPAVAGVRSDTFFGPTLYGKVEFSGVVASAAGNSLTLTGAAFTADQFNGANGAFFLEITNGASEGYYADITGTTANSVTLFDNFSSLITAGTTTVVIRKHHTVASLLGATNSIGLQAGAKIGDADQVVILDSVTQQPLTIFYSTDEFAPGWVDAGFNSKANVVIAPSQGLVIKRVGTAALGAVQVGYVKKGKTVFGVDQGENVISIPLATGTTLAASTLGTVITPGAKIGEADNVVVNTGDNKFETFFFSTDEFAAGWVDASFADKSSTPLKEGSAILIKNSVPATNGLFNITFPAQGGL